jgi:hypothetical protein
VLGRQKFNKAARIERLDVGLVGVVKKFTRGPGKDEIINFRRSSDERSSACSALCKPLKKNKIHTTQKKQLFSHARQRFTGDHMTNVLNDGY